MIKQYIPKTIQSNGWNRSVNNMIDGLIGTNAECMITTGGTDIKLTFDEIDKSKVVSATLKVYGEAWDYGDGTNIRIKPTISNKEIKLPTGKRLHSLDITEDFKSKFNHDDFNLRIYATSVMWETTAVIGEIYIELNIDEAPPVPIIDGSVDFSDERIPETSAQRFVNNLAIGNSKPNKIRIGNQEPKKIYLGNKLVYGITQEGMLLEDPSISISKNKYKIRLEKDGYVEYFDCTTSPNTQSPGYVKSKEVQDEKGNTFYLALFNEGSSAFRIDGLVPANGGWTTGRPPLNSHSALMYTGKINLDIGFVNVRNSIPKKVLEDGLKAVNSAIKGLNYHIVDRSMNTGELVNVPDNYYGVLYRSADHFDFKMNGRLMNNFGGEYTGSKANNGWIATFVHELSHSMAIPDGLTHTPTLYYGDINRDVILQSNDIEFLVSEYKRNYGIDLRNLAATNKYVAKERHAINEFDFFYPIYEDIEKEADVIKETKVVFKETVELYDTEYNIYKLDDETCIKIHNGLHIEFKKDTKYKLYLKTYEDCYATLMNDSQSIEKIK